MISKFRNIIYIIIIFVVYIPINGWNFELLLDWTYYFKVIPFLFLYLIFSELSTKLIGLSLVSIITYNIVYVSELKSKVTGIPLRYQDLLNFQQISIVSNYIDFKLISLTIFTIVLILYFFYSIFKSIEKRIIINKKIYSAYKIITISSLGLFSLFPITMGDYLNSLNAEKIYNILNIKYVRWKDEINLKNNGIYFHLIFTAQIKKIKKYSEADMASELLQQNELKNENNNIDKIIFLLCESCWNTQGDQYEKILTSVGLKSARMISPVFGGGTANSEFEVLTGLPVRNLSGIVFQEYGDIFNKNIVGLNSNLSEKKYKSILIQGSSKKLWNGENIYPKFGFDEVISDEEIGYSLSKSGSDKIIYSKLLDKINDEKKVFAFVLSQSTHGPYKDNNDGGDGDYKEKLLKSYLDISNLKKTLDVKYKGKYLLVIFGDHRPGGLSTKYYSESNFNKEMLDFIDMTKRNDSTEILKNKYDVLKWWDIVGDVPVYYSEALPVNLSVRLNYKNLYCLSPLVLDSLEYKMDNSWNNFLVKCDSYSNNKLDHWKKYPESIYYRNLFK